MTTKNRTWMNYRLTVILALIVGVAGIALQFIPDFELLSFMLSMAVLGSLIGGEETYEARDRQQLGRSYRKAFEWMLLAVLFAYALIVISRSFLVIEAAAAFLNDHWPGLILSMMCITMGIAGLRKARAVDSA